MLQTVSRIIQEVNAAEDFNEALQKMVYAIQKTLSTDACSIFLLNPSSPEYVLMATTGLNADAIGHFRRGIKQGIVGLIGEQEKPIKVTHAPTHPHFLKCPELKEEQYTALLGVPIIHHRQLFGVLTVQQIEARDFDESEAAFLITMSAQLASVISHADANGILTHQLNPTHQDSSILRGISGSPGIAIGTIIPVYPLIDLDTVPDRVAENIEEEILSFEKALTAARKEIRSLSTTLKKTLPPEEHALFSAYARILGKNHLGVAVKQEIQKGHWAQGALRRVIQQHIHQLENVEDDYLRQLAMDFRDLGQRVLSHLQTAQNTRPEYPPNTILAGENLTATILAEVPRELLAGIISLRGSANSHVAILARALGLPAVMGIENISLSMIDDVKVIVDGYNGEVHISPTAELEQKFSQVVEQQRQLDAGLEQLRQLPAKTLDGYAITLSVNIGLTTDLDTALKSGAESVGLYRTEVPFMTHNRFPAEIEQQTVYQKLLQTFAPRPVTMRTLDIGGDKALPYFPIEEENPFLGWRGIRITLDHPEVFLMQIRAMLRASHKLNNLRIMLPMISDVSEVDESLTLIKRAYHEVLEEKIKINMPLVGVMIEVPSAVYQTEVIAKRVDFLSVGSNDLIQYLLAVDRNNPRVAALYNALHPAVLRALTHIILAARQAEKPVSICGEMTSDPATVIALLGMGFTSLSMNSTSLPRIKWVIRNFTQKRSQEILAEILEMDNPHMIRSHLEKALEQAGLAELTQLGM